MYCLICQSEACCQGWNLQRTDPEGDKIDARDASTWIEAAQTLCQTVQYSSGVVFSKASIAACFLPQRLLLKRLQGTAVTSPLLASSHNVDADRIAAS
tara:strand:+ start:169 stop:462 length:294 start_codon:yes stop_codon:yes gene_type:complete